MAAEWVDSAVSLPTLYNVVRDHSSIVAVGNSRDYLPHGEAGELHAELGLDGAGIAAEIVKVHKSDRS